MKSNQKFIGLKDLVLDILLSLLVLVISLIVVPITSPLGIMWGSMLAGMIPAFLGGSIYVLMQTKAPRIGTSFLFSVPFAIYFIISGSIPTGVIFLLTAIVGELTMIGGYDKKLRPIVPYIIHWLTYFLAATFQFIFMRSAVVKTYMGMGMDEAAANTAIDAYSAIYTAPQNIIFFSACAALSAGLGYFLGTKVLRKHFVPAGVA